MNTLAAIRWLQFVPLGDQLGGLVAGVGQALDGIELSIATLQRAETLLPVVERLAAWAITMQGIKSIGAVILVAAIWKGTKIVEARRLADAQSGANVRV
jgi:hypothetical protein